MNRSSFLQRSFWGITGLSLFSGLYAWQIEPFWLEFVRLKMPIKNLPEALVGKTLIQISDIHVGKRFDHRFVIDSFRKAEALRPDFVVYTGDYISMTNNEVPYTVLDEVLAHVVKGELGTIGILGNHDYGTNWAQPFVADQVQCAAGNNGL